MKHHYNTKYTPFIAELSNTYTILPKKTIFTQNIQNQTTKFFYHIQNPKKNQKFQKKGNFTRGDRMGSQYTPLGGW